MTRGRESNKPKPVCVVLDTNIWVRKTSLLRTASGAALTHRLLELNGRLGLPSIVEEEIVKQSARFGRELVAPIRENVRQLAPLLGRVDEYLMLLPTESDFEASVQERLRELDKLFVRVPFSFEHAKSALQRVMDETPPNKPGKQQYKDSAIWEAILELSRTHLVHFVTEDKASETSNERRGTGWLLLVLRGLG